MIFTDSMQIPVGAPNAFTAQKMIDFVYDPQIQAAITAYVNYVPPVKGVKEELVKLDPDLANNTLIVPDEALLAQMHQYDSEALNDDEHITAWQEVLGQ